MTGFRVGLADLLIYTGLGPMAMTRANYLAAAATKDIPDSLIGESFLTGTPDDVVDQAARLRDSGLRYAVLCNMSIGQPNIKRGMAASIPFTGILRQLRRL